MTTLPINQKEYLKKYFSKDSKKKKKKNKSKIKRAGMKLVEENSDLPFDFEDEEDAPMVAEITYDDERMKVPEDFQSHKWKKFQKLTNDIKSTKQSNLLYDLNESQQMNSTTQDNDKFHRRKRHDSDSSPPPKKKDQSSASPPRRKRHDSDASPPKRKREKSDALPARAKSHKSDSSPFRKNFPSGSKTQQDSTASPPKRKRHDSDASPPRGKRDNSDASPPRRKRHDSDSTSPPRRKRKDSDTSPPRRKRNDSVTSPPRRKRNDSDTSPPRRKRNDSDTSPPRRKRHDSDTSPPRRKRHDSDGSPPRKNPKSLSQVKNADSREFESQPVIKSRPEKNMTTNEYLKARRSGKLKKDTPEDLLRKEREKGLQTEAAKKYQQWNKGLVQEQNQRDHVANTVHEMGKSFARSVDDRDMNDSLRNKRRAEDHMFEYVMKKKVEMSTKGPAKPLYQGSFPPNRFNIRPGYRWDGVDRSSGYELKWFNQQNSKKAVEEESYKWSVEDM